jgi:hypothetical protein
MNGNTVKPRRDPVPRRRPYLRLRALQRAGLLGPLIRLQRKLDGR